MKFEEIKKYFIEDEDDGRWNFDEEKLDNMTRKEIKEMFLSILEKCDDYETDGDKDGLYFIVLIEDGTLTFSSTHHYTDELEEVGKKIDGIWFEEDLEKKRINELPIAILNTTILTADGDFSLKTISLKEAKKLIKEKEILSAVGHESTSQILTNLLKVDVPVNRIQFKQESGQKALCFKLLGRPEEGKILTLKEIEEIGYEFKILEMK